jgi:hypothetical protein
MSQVAALALIAERLLFGRQRYGELHVSTDRRDFCSEALGVPSTGGAVTTSAHLSLASR